MNNNLDGLEEVLDRVERVEITGEDDGYMQVRRTFYIGGRVDAEVRLKSSFEGQWSRWEKL